MSNFKLILAFAYKVIRQWVKYFENFRLYMRMRG